MDPLANRCILTIHLHCAEEHEARTLRCQDMCDPTTSVERERPSAAGCHGLVWGGAMPLGPPGTVLPAGVARLWEEAGENAQAWWNGARGPRCGKDRRVIWSLSTLSWVGTYNEIMGFLLAKKHLADILARLFGSTTA